jgi:hypothetical protein
MRLTRVFLDISMAKGFEGLREVAKEAKAKLGPDSTVLFMNRRGTSFKIVINDTYIVYYKNGNRKIPLDSLRYLPNTFGGTELELQGAIRKSLMTKLHLEIPD